MNEFESLSRITKNILIAIKAVVGIGPVALHQPLFDGNEWKYLKECLDTNYVSSVGPFVEKFERSIAAFTGAKNVIATVNGTSALHVALILGGVKPNDEVLVPAFSFVATANAVRYVGAFPHFVDIEERTLGIDCGKLKEYLQSITKMEHGFCINKVTGKKISSIVPMHTFGHPVDLEGILEIAEIFNLSVVEDAAESIGSKYKNQHTGTFGQLGVLSFNGNKTITTGGGGAILTNDDEIAEIARHLTTTAKIPHEWKYDHDEIGFNYRMPNINAALGYAQMERIEIKIEKKRMLFKKYQKAFKNIPEIKIFEEPNSCLSNYWLQSIILREDCSSHRDEILNATNKFGFGTRPAWTPLNRLMPYLNSQTMDLQVTNSMWQRIINLPSGNMAE